jgi:hypothetical protein
MRTLEIHAPHAHPNPVAPRVDHATQPVPPPQLPVLAERGGTQLRTPLPVAIVDTREQNPLSFRRFKGWFARIEERALPQGDYSVGGMENSCVVERKDLADLIQSLTTNRQVFVRRLQRMSHLPHSLLVITAPLAEIKTEYPYRAANPNRITQSLIAVLRDCACTSSALIRTNSARRSSPPVSIRRFCMIGWNITATAATWPMEICKSSTF